MTNQPAMKTRLGARRVTFFKHANRIRELLAEGHTQRAVYHDELGGEAALGMTYSTFNRYVKREILKQEPRREHQSQGGISTVAPAPDRPDNQPKSDGNAKPEGRRTDQFHHDPLGGINKDNLI
jgi:hypothetical protein